MRKKQILRWSLCALAATLVCGVFSATKPFSVVAPVKAEGDSKIHTPVSWSASAFGSTGNVSLEENVTDAEAYGGVAAYKATLSSSGETTGVKLMFAETVNLNDYAHVFVRWKNYNATSVDTATLRVGVNSVPVAGTQGYPFYDVNGNSLSRLYYEHYFSYDLKDMADGITDVDSLYIGRTGGVIASGSIELYIDHVDFVKDPLKLENVISFKNVGQDKTYDVSEADRYSNAKVLATNKGSSALSAWQGWDIDIYSGNYAFVGNLGVSTSGTFDTRALTIGFDNIDMSNYQSVKIRIKNFNTDSVYSTNCTTYLKLNGEFWTSEQSQSLSGGLPKNDWNLNPISNTGHTEEQMRSTYFEYDLLTMAGYPNPLQSITFCRGNNVNGNKIGIVIYIESIEFVPYVIQKTDTLKLGKVYRLEDVFSLADGVGESSAISMEGYLNTDTPIGVLTNLGSFVGGKFAIDGGYYDVQNKTYTVCLAVKGIETLTGKTGFATYTFNVDESLELSYNGLPLFVGVDFDLDLLFDAFGAVQSREYTVNGTPSLGTFKAEEKGDYTVKCKITDGDESEELTVTVQAIDFALQSEITDEFEKGREEIFADPVLPFDGVRYTTRLFKGTDDIGTAKPLTTGNGYVFTEEGSYKLVYDIYFASTDKTVTFTTVYNVTLTEQKPTIELTGVLQDVYYTGTTVTLPKAKAETAYRSYKVDVKVTTATSDVSVSGGKIVLASAGEYVVRYTVTGDGFTVEKVLSFNVLEDTEAPEIFLYGNYAEHYEAGTFAQVLMAKVFDDSDAEIEAEVKVYKGSKEVTVTDGKFRLENGTYSVVYTAKDAVGHTTEKTVKFTVGDGSNGKGTDGCGGSLSVGMILPVMSVLIATVAVVRKKGRREDE